jgi:hypothetical protein
MIEGRINICGETHEAQRKIKKIELRKLWDGRIKELWQLQETQKERKL